ncbi:MAG: hypothetical protein SGILL_004114, partial [Bacillariaceae sp.]
MQTEWTDELLNAKADAETSGEVLTDSLLLISQTSSEDSQFSYPLRSTTQEYLYSGFLSRIEEFDEETYGNQEESDVHSEGPVEIDSSTTTSKQSHTFFDMYNDMVTVDVQIKLWIEESVVITDPKFIKLKAEMLPTVAFTEPVKNVDGIASNKPSNSEVHALFGNEWMMDELLGSVVQNYKLQLGNNPNHPLWMQRISAVQAEAVQVASSAPQGNNSGWSSALQNFMLSLLLMLVVGAVVVLGFAARHRRQQKRYEQQLQALHGGDLSLNGNGGNNGGDFQDEYSVNSKSYQDHPQRLMTSLSQDGDASFMSEMSSGASTGIRRPPSINTRQTSLDSARHGSDVFHRSPQQSALTALEASDRYLSKHRPDLYSDDSASQSSSIFGRSYLIPSNPFEWLYGGGGSGRDGDRDGHFPGFGGGSAASAASGSNIIFGGAAGMFATPTAAQDVPRRTSFTTPSPSTTPPSAFTPVSSQTNLAALAGTGGNGDGNGGSHHDDGNMFGSGNGGTTPSSHTGNAWAAADFQDDTPSVASSVVGSIFRNLSMSSWVSGSQHSQQQQQQQQQMQDFDYQHQDPSLLLQHQPGDIELEELQDEEYDFAFQDFPRADGTPCLIYKDDQDELKERQRKSIFVIDDDLDQADDNDNGSTTSSQHTDTETKQDDASAKPVSDHAFMRMLSENSLAIDDEPAIEDERDELILHLPGEGPNDDTSGKSPQFQQQLGRLLETKQRRYAMEYKKEAIVKEQRLKRKEVREQQRVDRHKAMERDLEEIEAEFLSPLARDMQEKQQQQQQQSALHPPRSPKPPGLQQQHHQRQRSGNLGAASPARRGHQRQNSLGAASPFRRQSSNSNHSNHNRSLSHNMGAPSPRVVARTAYSSQQHQRSITADNGGIFRSASHDVGDRSMDSSQHGSGGGGGGGEYQMKVRPVNMYERDMFGGSATQEDLSLPTMSGNPKYPSPQAVVDEILQPSRHSKTASIGGGGGGGAGRQPHTFNHRRSRSSIQNNTGSFDVVDFGGVNHFAQQQQQAPPPQRSPLKQSSSHRRSQSSSIAG